MGCASTGCDRRLSPLLRVHGLDNPPAGHAQLRAPWAELSHGCRCVRCSFACRAEPPLRLKGTAVVEMHTLDDLEVLPCGGGAEGAAGGMRVKGLAAAAVAAVAVALTRRGRWPAVAGAAAAAVTAAGCGVVLVLRNLSPRR